MLSSTRRLLVPLFVTLALPLSVIAEVDGEKKEGEEEKPRAELDRPGGGSLEENLLEESKKNLEEIQRLLDEVRGRLSDRDTGSSTQEKQSQATKKLQSLIEKLLEAANQQGQGGGSSQENANQQQKPGGQSKESKGEKKPGEKQSEAESRKNQKQVSGGKPEDGDPEKNENAREKNDQRVENNRTSESDPPKAGAARAIEELKRSKRWGMLPPKLREEMTSAAGKEAPREYRELIELYYKRLSDYYTRSRR